MPARRPILEIQRLSVAFPMKGAMVTAVHDLDLDIPHGAVTCLVGESGCGKSLTARAVLRLTPENARLAGKVLFAGKNLLKLPEKSLCHIRGNRIAMIFQEPMTALNPAITVGNQAAEPLRLHRGMSRHNARAEVERLFAAVGIASGASRYDDFPHQLSGGMRQRVMIAMALACGPELLLADEPTTALDATIQRQILRLIIEQSRQRDMAVLLISHDLGVVSHIADDVGVMYAGCLVERAPAAELFAHPCHPYTQGLMDSAPSARSRGLHRLPTIPGAVPALNAMPAGCRFAPRCGRAIPRCATDLPPFVTAGGHGVACWLHA